MDSCLNFIMEEMVKRQKEVDNFMTIGDWEQNRLESRETNMRFEYN